MPQLFWSVDWAGLSRVNIERTRQIMKEKSIDVIVCNGMENVRYLTAFSPFNAMAMVKTHMLIMSIKTDQPTLYILNYYADYLKEAAPWIEDVKVFSMDVGTDVAKFIKTSNIRNGRIAVDGFISYGEGQQISGKVEQFGCEVVSSDIMMQARMIKNSIEVNIIKEAAAVAEMGMMRALESCVEGKREYEVAAEAEFAVRNAGAEAPAFSAIVASGHNGVICKEISSDKRLRNGELVMIDQGAMYEGYNAEYARTGCVGVPNDEQKKAYRIVLEAEQTAIKAVKPGIKAGEIDKIARKVIEKAGYGDWQHKYATGHGLGIAVWEPPVIYSGSNDILKSGMIIALEPGIHKPGIGGIRIEDVILVTESGSIILTKSGYWDV